VEGPNLVWDGAKAGTGEVHVGKRILADGGIGHLLDQVPAVGLVFVDAVRDPDPIRERLDLAADELGYISVTEPGLDEAGRFLAAGLLAEGTLLRDDGDEPGVWRETRRHAFPVMGKDRFQEPVSERDAVDR
jgi:hypothetical protein